MGTVDVVVDGGTGEPKLEGGGACNWVNGSRGSDDTFGTFGSGAGFGWAGVLATMVSIDLPRFKDVGVGELATSIALLPPLGAGVG